MSTSKTESKNASGLFPSESKNLKERPPQNHESKILQALKEMYSCKPTNETFSVYSSDAVFHDPVGIAQGRDSIRAQFVGLAKIFPRADIPKFRILETPATLPRNSILIDQDVAYYRNATSSSPTKVMNSLVTLVLNDQNQVKNHYEEWNHEKTSTSEDGFLGMLNEQRKKLTAGLTDLFVGKDSKA